MVSTVVGGVSRAERDPKQPARLAKSSGLTIPKAPSSNLEGKGEGLAFKHETSQRVISKCLCWVDDFC